MPNHPAAWPASIRTGWRSGKPCVPSLTDKGKRVLTTTRCGIEACPLAAQHNLSVELRGGSLHLGSPLERHPGIFLEAYGVHLVWKVSHIGEILDGSEEFARA